MTPNDQDKRLNYEDLQRTFTIVKPDVAKNAVGDITSSSRKTVDAGQDAEISKHRLNSLCRVQKPTHRSLTDFMSRANCRVGAGRKKASLTAQARRWNPANAEEGTIRSGQ
jgi:nucleoside diphosphate kinase